MKPSFNQIQIKVHGLSDLSHVHIHTLSLLYQPIIGKEAFSLYMLLHGLLDKTALRSVIYPLSFILDALSLSEAQFVSSRKTLEAIGLMDTYYGDDTYIFSLYHPLSPSGFIKDSPYGAYLKAIIGESRYNDITSQFKISKIKTSTYKHLTVSFDEVFGPLKTPPKTKVKSFEQEETLKPSIKHSVDIEAVLSEIPSHLMSERFKTKRFKEKLKEIAYIYSLDEKAMIKLIKGSIENQEIDFAQFKSLAADYYHNLPKQTIKKQNNYSEDYFQSVHPKELLEASTGSKAAKSELATLERILDEIDLPHEVINVMIAYVLKELNGQFPVFEYFNKVAATWKRNNITTASEAIDHIKKMKTQKKQPKPSYQSHKKADTRPKDTDVDWFDDYLKDQEESS